MWKNAVVFSSATDATCGLFLTKIDEGRGKISIFFGQDTPSEVRSQFEEYVSSHIAKRAVPNTLKRFRVFTCPDPSCATPVSEIAIQRWRERGFGSINCNVCGAEIVIEDATPVSGASSIAGKIDRVARAKRLRESALISASGELRAPGFRQWAGSNLSTLALVFTDVVGSTALANELGDEQMGAIRRAHFKHGRTLIGQHKGKLIKTIGDSLMVAFRTAMEALDFALAFHADSGHPDVRIRAGIHVGPVEIEEEDAFGTMVNYAARVVAHSKDAAIWVSDRAHADILQRRSQAHSVIRWQEDRAKLKGFAEEQVLWQALPQPRLSSE